MEKITFYTHLYDDFQERMDQFIVNVARGEIIEEKNSMFYLIL
ncbi:MAG: hypothetical protein U9N62_09260 [Thermotogota bacterium]|nr:hypothetical protein [Thermotogota bacterium]